MLKTNKSRGKNENKKITNILKQFDKGGKFIKFINKKLIVSTHGSYRSYFLHQASLVKAPMEPITQNANENLSHDQKNKHKTKRNCHKNLLSKIPLQFLRLSYVCVCVKHSSRKLKQLPILFFEEKFKRGNKVKDKICCCCVWEVKLSQEGEMRTQMEIQVLVCKKLFFPKETLMEMGIVLWVILLLFHYDLILLIAIAIPCGFLY